MILVGVDERMHGFHHHGRIPYIAKQRTAPHRTASVSFRQKRREKVGNAAGVPQAIRTVLYFFT